MTEVRDLLAVPARPFAWPLLGPAAPDTCALVVIDMQVDFVNSGGWFASMGFNLAGIQAIVPVLQGVLRSARAVPGLTVIHTRQGNAPDLSDLPPAKLEQSRRAGIPYGHRGPHGRGLVRGESGWELIEELRPAPGEFVIDKPGFSAFADTSLGTLLTGRGIRSLVLTGVTANVCVLATLYGAIDRGYDCVTVGDAIAGADPASVETVLGLIRYQAGLLGAVTEATTLATAFGAATDDL